MNGEESEAKKIVASIKEQTSSEAKSGREQQSEDGLNSKRDATVADDEHESDITQYSSESANEVAEVKKTEGKADETFKHDGSTTRQRRSTRSTKGKNQAG